MNDLARINSSVCAFISNNDTGTTRAGSRIQHSNSDGSWNNRSASGMSQFEPAYRMTAELSTLINRLYTGQEKQALRRPDSRMDCDAWSMQPRATDSSHRQRHVSDILNDPSNTFLLTSTYSRLLDLINSILPTMQTDTNPSDVIISLGAFDLANRPGMKTFVIVNMVELLIRRTDHVLKLVEQDVKHDHAPGARSRALNDFELERNHERRRLDDGLSGKMPKGLGFVLEMVSEQQETLLTRARDLRRQLLAAADLWSMT